MRSASPILLALMLLGLSASAIAGDSPAAKAKDAPRRLSATFQNQDVIDVIQSVAHSGKMNVIVSPKVKGKISITFKDRPAVAALQQIAARLGACLEHEDYGIYTIVPLDDRELVEEYYKFRTWRADSKIRTKVFFETGIAPLVQREGGDWRYVEQEHALHFWASKTTVKAIRSILDALDRPTKKPKQPSKR